MSSSRRTFLKSAAAAATAAGVASMTPGSPARAADAPAALAAAAPSPAASPAAGKATIYKAVKWGMVKHAGSVLDKFKLLKDLGYDGVELSSPGGVDKNHALEASAKTGLPIHGVVCSSHWQIRLSDPNPEVRDKALDNVLTAIKDSHACDGSSVLLVVGHGKDGTPEEVAERSIAQIRKALPLAAKLGVYLLHENVWNHFLYDHDGGSGQTAEPIVSYIDTINSPWFGAYYDIGNHRKYGVPSQWAATLGRRIVKLDVKDFDHKQNKWADIGQGTVDWPQVRDVLNRIGFHGWATAEVGGGDENRLKQIKKQMDEVLG